MSFQKVNTFVNKYVMNLLKELLLLSEEESHPLDFFHALTKMDRMFNGYPQEYGFHHHHDKSEYHGTFVTRDGRGKVHKKSTPNNSAIYSCVFDDANLHDKYLRHEQVLDAVQASTPNHWNFLAMPAFKKCKDPSFCVDHAAKDGDIEIHVHHDTHPSIK